GLRQAQHRKVSARREARHLVKCLAKCPLAYLKRAAQGRDVQRLVEIGESQSLCLFDEIAARVALLSEWRICDGCEPMIDIHGNPPKLDTMGRLHPAAAHHCAGSNDIVLWGKWPLFNPAARRRNEDGRMQEP